MGGEDADDGAAGGGLWCGDCFELEAGFEGLEDEGAMVRGEVRSHGEEYDDLTLWEKVGWLYVGLHELEKLLMLSCLETCILVYNRYEINQGVAGLTRA